jgi:hypothetical protein
VLEKAQKKQLRLGKQKQKKQKENIQRMETEIGRVDKLEADRMQVTEERTKAVQR